MTATETATITANRNCNGATLMGDPLLPMQESPLNIGADAEAARQHAFDALENGNGNGNGNGHTGVHSHSSSSARRSTGLDSVDSADSSPFVNNVDDTSTTSSNQENHSPSKDKRRSRIMSGSEISPLKMLQRTNSETSSTTATSTSTSHHQSNSIDDKLMPPVPKSPRKSVSPLRRFPVRVNTGESNPRGRPQSIPPPVHEQQEPEEDNEPERPRSEPKEISIDEAIAQNPGVRHAIEIFEDTLDSMGDDDDDATSLPDEGATPRAPTDPQPQQEDAEGDETMGDESMMSAFSTFSAIPNMTTFARLGGRTPNQMPQDARRGSNTTNLLEFTDSQRFPGGRSSPTKFLTVADAKKTPNRQSIANLLDFEIPPMPTPRSVPSISARELESLKSNFMSEISSLRATLSGKEAEAASLKTALMDAEKRAGETGEQLREERNLREQCTEDKDTWEKRGREMETVLRQVKDEIMTTQREREALEARLEESEGRREAAEMMAQEAESKMAAMRASKVGGGNDAANSPGGAVRSPKGTASTQREIELAVEKVARELHTAYKSKHEAKVAALKKNYEVRWDKKIRELEAKIEELSRENDELRQGRDATLTKVEVEAGERRDQAVKDSAQIKELRAEVEKLEAVLKTVQSDNNEIRRELEAERVEKGELVTLSEELMQMQSMQSFIAQNNNNTNNNTNNQSPPERRMHHPVEQQQQQQQQQPHQYTPPKRVAQRASAPVPPRGQTGFGLTRSATSAVAANTPKKMGLVSPSGLPGAGAKSANRNSMIGRPPGGLSGLKAPGSRIGGPPQAQNHQRGQSSGLVRPGSGLARPGGLMSSIQQMGSYRGRGE